MRYVRMLLLAVVGMVPAMRFGFSALLVPQGLDEFGRSAAVTEPDETIRAALRDATRKDDVAQVKKLFERPDGQQLDGKEIERRIRLYKDGDGQKVTAWLSAANRLSFNVLQLFVPYLNQAAKNYALLQAAVPEPQDGAGQSAQQAIFRLLLDAGANGEAAAKSWDTQANAAQGEDAATKKRHAKCIRDAMAAIEAERQAAARGRAPSYEVLSRHRGYGVLGANVPAVSQEQINALIVAAWKGHLDEVIQSIRDQHVPVNGQGVNPERPLTDDIHRQQRPRMETAIYNAASAGWLNVVDYLIQQGADVNASVYIGYPKWDHPLRAAVRNAHVKVVERLLAVPGLGINTGDGKWGGQTALALAQTLMGEVAHPDKIAAYEAIIDAINRQLRLNEQKGGGVVAAPEMQPVQAAVDISDDVFYGACQNGVLESVTKSLKKNEKLINGRDHRDLEWPTGLMWAATNGHEDIVGYLVEQGADVNARDNHNRTALRWANSKNQLEIVKYLVNTGKCDHESIHDTLVTALAMGNKDIADFLYKHGAQPAQSLMLISKRLQLALPQEKTIVEQTMAIAASELIKMLREKDAEASDCSICFKTFNDKDVINVLKCGHYFDTKCWSAENKQPCPMCRSTAGSAFTFNMLATDEAVGAAREKLQQDEGERVAASKYGHIGPKRPRAPRLPLRAPVPPVAEAKEEAPVVVAPPPALVLSPPAPAPQQSPAEHEYAPQAAGAQWECPFCTYLNAAGSSTCEICNNQRPQAPAVIVDEPKEPAVPQVTWACPTCTYENPNDNPKCTMCGKPNPNQKQVQRQQQAGWRTCSKGHRYDGRTSRRCPVCYAHIPQVKQKKRN